MVYSIWFIEKEEYDVKKMFTGILSSILLVGFLGSMAYASPKQPDSHRWKVWKTITLGEYKTTNVLRNAIRASGNVISRYADGILNKVLLSQTKKTIHLVFLTTKQITGKDYATITEVFAGAARLGLHKCPAEVGPYLREQYKDQPNNEWILIGMDSISDFDGRLSVFRVGCYNDVLWLRGYYDEPGSVWLGSALWVFVGSK